MIYRTVTLLLICFITGITCKAQSDLYSAARAGLNLREAPEQSSKVLDKVPFGEKMKVVTDTLFGVAYTEGMQCYWQKVHYMGKTGYVANAYALPIKPPAAAPDDLLIYLETVATKVGENQYEVRYMEELGVRVEKKLFKSGLSYRIIKGYEYFKETIWLPGFSMEQAFVLARLISPISGLLNQEDAFPGESKKSEEMDSKSIEVKYAYKNLYPQYVRLEYCEGACYILTLDNEGGEISISISAGV